MHMHGSIDLAGTHTVRDDGMAELTATLASCRSWMPPWTCYEHKVRLRGSTGWRWRAARGVVQMEQDGAEKKQGRAGRTVPAGK